MNIVVLRETQEGEARVALMPESIKKLVALKASVQVESGAGLSAARTDNEYREAGAEISSDREALLNNADVLAVVGELRVDFIGDKDDLIARGETSETLDLVARKRQARGI